MFPLAAVGQEAAVATAVTESETETALAPETTEDTGPSDTGEIELVEPAAEPSELVEENLEPVPIQPRSATAAQAELASQPTPATPVPPGYAKVIVSVGSDLLPEGVFNNATQVRGRLNSVREVSPAQGATLRLHNRAHDGAFGTREANEENPGPPIYEDWAVCTVDSNAECTFLIPVRDDRWDYYWIKQETASPGYYPMQEVRIGGSGESNTFNPTGTVLDYAYATPHLDSGETYWSGVNYSSLWRLINPRYGSDQGDRSNSFMHGHNQPIYTASLVRPRGSMGAFQEIRHNPELQVPKSCEPTTWDVALMLDTSGSLGNSTNVRSSARNIINQLEGTRATLSIGTFSSNSPGTRQDANRLGVYRMDQPAEVASLRSYINGITRVAGSTNWDEGFRELAHANTRNAGKFDVAFFVTDGNPTMTSRDGFRNIIDEGAYNDFRHVEAAVAAANTLKGQGTRVVAVGIPSETGLTVSPVNLASVSGPTRWTPGMADPATADYFLFNDTQAYEEVLSHVLTEPIDCRIEVEKRIQNPPGATADTTGEGWTFNATTQAGLTFAPGEPAAQQTDASSLAVWRFDRNAQGEVEILEDLTAPAGSAQSYRLVPTAEGKNAACYFLTDSGEVDAAVPSHLIDNVDGQTQAGVRIRAVDSTQPIRCVFTNEPKVEVSLSIVKLGVDPTGTEPIELSGASFALERIDEANGAPVELQPDSNGTWFSASVQPGRYRLVETQAPAGFMLLPNPVYFDVGRNDQGLATVTLVDPAENTGVVNIRPTSAEAPERVTMEVIDATAGQLPETGGPGALLPIGAGLLVALLGIRSLPGRRRT